MDSTFQFSDIDDETKDDVYYPERRRVTGRAWAIFGLILVADVLTLVSIVAPGWAWTRERDSSGSEQEQFGDYGLWQLCHKPAYDPEGKGRRSYCLMILQLKNLQGWLITVQILTSVSALLCFISTILVCVYIFMKKHNKQPPLCASYLATCGLTAGCQIAAATLFAVKFLEMATACSTGCPGEDKVIYQYHLNYCFVCHVCSASSYLLVTIMAIVELVTIIR